MDVLLIPYASTTSIIVVLCCQLPIKTEVRASNCNIPSLHFQQGANWGAIPL